MQGSSLQLVTKFKTAADSQAYVMPTILGQEYSGCGRPEAGKTGQRFFSVLTGNSETGGVNALQSKGDYIEKQGCYLSCTKYKFYVIYIF